MANAVAGVHTDPPEDRADLLARGRKPGAAILADGRCVCRIAMSRLIGPACSYHYDLYEALARAEREAYRRRGEG